MISLNLIATRNDGERPINEPELELLKETALVSQYVISNLLENYKTGNIDLNHAIKPFNASQIQSIIDSANSLLHTNFVFNIVELPETKSENETLTISNENFFNIFSNFYSLSPEKAVAELIARLIKHLQKLKYPDIEVSLPDLKSILTNFLQFQKKQHNQPFTKRKITDLSIARASVLKNGRIAYVFGGEYYYSLDFDDNYINLNTPKRISEEFNNWPQYFHNDIEAGINLFSPKADRVVFFKDNMCICYDWNHQTIVEGLSGNISDVFHNLPIDFHQNIDAALALSGIDSGFGMLFKGNQCVKIDLNTLSAIMGYPRQISDEWSSFPPEYTKGITSAIPGGGKRSIKAYFFKDDSYIRYDWQTNNVDKNYPINYLDNWDGALYWVMDN